MFQNLSTFVLLDRPVWPLRPFSLTPTDRPLWLKTFHFRLPAKGSEESQKWIFGLEWNELKNEHSETEAGAGYTRDNIC